MHIFVESYTFYLKLVCFNVNYTSQIDLSIYYILHLKLEISK